MSCSNVPPPWLESLQHSQIYFHSDHRIPGDLWDSATSLRVWESVGCPNSGLNRCLYHYRLVGWDIFQRFSCRYNNSTQNKETSKAIIKKRIWRINSQNLQLKTNQIDLGKHLNCRGVLPAQERIAARTSKLRGRAGTLIRCHWRQAYTLRTLPSSVLRVPTRWQWASEGGVLEPTWIVQSAFTPLAKTTTKAARESSAAINLRIAWNPWARFCPTPDHPVVACGANQTPYSNPLTHGQLML